MKSLVFDTGPIISLATNNLLQILRHLKEKFRGEFWISRGVHYEIIERPLKSKRFKFEALQVERMIEEGVLKIYENDKITKKAGLMLDQVNNCFRAKNNYIKAVQFAEIETLMLAKEVSASAVIIDEIITRLLVENPLAIKEIMKRRLGTEIEVNQLNLKELQSDLKELKILRSSELVAVAYESGFLDKYIVNIPHAKKELLEGILWGVKLNGCAISEEEINEILKLAKSWDYLD